MKAIAKFVKSVREKLELDTKEFAGKVGVKSVSTVTKWEKGDAMPREENLERMANLLGGTLSDCLFLPGEVRRKVAEHVLIEREIEQLSGKKPEAKAEGRTKTPPHTAHG